MSETTKDIESKKIRKFLGTPVTGNILKKILSIYHRNGEKNIERGEAIATHIKLFSRDGDQRHFWGHPSNPGILVISGPHFHDEVDPDRPETFEFLELVIRDESLLAAIENKSTDVWLEEIRNESRREAKRVSTPQLSCPGFSCGIG